MYPSEAFRKEIEGHVLVKVCFDTTGVVFGTEILESEPNGVFDDAVLRCANKWLVNRLDGRPLEKNLCVKQKITMKLPKEGS
jgi:protein TonB